MQAASPLLVSLTLATLAGAQASEPLGVEAATLSDDRGLAADAFGVSVALSGTRAIVGASGVDFETGFSGINAGSAWIFERQSDGSWLDVAQLAPGATSLNMGLGYRVDVDGDRALVGTLVPSVAYVFDREPDGTWVESAKLVPSELGSGLGASVSLQGDRAVVGRVAADPGGIDNAGTAFVFERSALGDWTEVAKLTPSDPIAGGFFGSSASLDGDRLVVGALGAKVGLENEAGALYVFERQGDATWLETAKLSASDASSFDRLGQNVSLSGDRIVAGVPEKWFPSAPGRGAAYVFERQGDGSWIEATQLLDADGGIADHFGSCVAIEGTRVVVGAEGVFTWTTSWVARGAVFQFERQGDGSWLQVARMIANGGGTTVGDSLALSGDRVLSGSPNTATVAGDDVGSARVFRLCTGCVAGYGTGTPGCKGAQPMSLTLAPELGMAGAQLSCDHAPSSTAGFGAVATAPDLAGTSLPGLGIVLHLDPLASSFLFQLPLTSDAFGLAVSPPFTIPDSGALVGTTLYAQSVWSWRTCSLPPLQLSSSSGVAITLLAP